MTRQGEARPDICVIGTDPAGIEIAFAAAALGVPVMLVTGGEGKGDPAAIRRLKALGVQIVEAEAAFLDARRASAGGMIIRPRRFVLAIEGAAAALPVSGWETVPAPAGKMPHLLVIGGASEAVEAALLARRQGSRVTLIAETTLLPGFDREAVDIIRAGLERAGLSLREAVTLDGGAITREDGARDPDTSALSLPGGGGPVLFTHLLDARGRRLLPESLDAGKAGLTVKDGIVATGPLLEAGRGIFVVGPANGRPAGHRSAEVGAVLGAALFRRRGKHFPALASRLALAHDGLGLPAIAECGLDEAGLRPAERARLRFLRVPVPPAPAVHGTPADHVPSGHIKVVATPAGLIRGVSILARNAADLIVPFQLAMAKGIRLPELAEIPIAAPSQSEAIAALARLFLRDRLTAASTKRMIRLLRLFG